MTTHDGPGVFWRPAATLPTTRTPMTAYRLTVTMTLTAADKPDADDYRWKRLAQVEAVIPASEVHHTDGLARLYAAGEAVAAVAGLDPWMPYAAASEDIDPGTTFEFVPDAPDEVGTIPAFPDGVLVAAVMGQDDDAALDAFHREAKAALDAAPAVPAEGAEDPDDLGDLPF